MKTVPLGEIVESCRASYGGDPGSRDVEAFVAKVSNVSGAGEFHQEFSTRSFSEKELSRLVARPGDLFVVKSSGSKKRILSGKTAMVRENSPTPLVASNFLFLLRPDTERVNPRYLWRVLNSPQSKAFVKTVVGAFTYPNLKWSTYRKHPIPLPLLSEQKRIAAILDAADVLRARSREALDQLNQLLHSTFLDMFGDTMTNPMGWEVNPLESLIDPSRPITYGILKPGPDIQGGIPYVRVVDIQEERILVHQLRRTTPMIADQYKRSRLKTGDVLVSIRGHVGRMAIVPPEADGANITQDTARLALSKAEGSYVMRCLTSQSMQHYMARRTKGVAVRGINLADVKKLPIPTPPLDLQHRFAVIAGTVEQQRACLRSHLSELDLLFASLQQRAFRGDL